MQSGYLRPSHSVVPLHVRPTSVLYGADWGFIDPNDGISSSSKLQQKLEDDFDTFTTIKAMDLVQPLVETQFSRVMSEGLFVGTARLLRISDGPLS
ncbi:hypothetical protein ACFX1Z_024585 [Malus domestica]